MLLDVQCEAVVGDFGLAKLLDHSDSHVTTAVRGTVGHIAPEYLSTGQSSDKTDVFGFGILLLELVTGQRAIQVGKGEDAGQSRNGHHKGFMLDWVIDLMFFLIFLDNSLVWCVYQPVVFMNLLSVCILRFHFLSDKQLYL